MEEFKSRGNDLILDNWEQCVETVTNSRSKRFSSELLLNSNIILYWKKNLAEDSIIKLIKDNFKIYRLNCAVWNTTSDCLASISRTLEFPNHFGSNLDAFNDCLSDMYPSVSDICIVFWEFDVFAGKFKEFAFKILNIIQRQSRYSERMGTQLCALVQTKDPTLAFNNIGAVDAEWNNNEWLNSSRGM